MVLVDVNSVNQPPSKLLDTLNTLATSTEYSKNEFGSTAPVIANLDRELKAILERDDLDPMQRLKIYNEKLQKYLFLVHENERKSPATTPKLETTIEKEENDDDINTTGGLDRTFSGPQTVKQGRASFIWAPGDNTATNTTPLQTTGGKQGKSNLPRQTPIQERLRSVAQRQKNSRYKDFLSNWDEYANE